MTKRETVFPAGRQALYEKNRYSAAIRSGDLVFVSGQVGGREEGTSEPDFAKQSQLAFDTLTAVLDAAGCGLDDIIDVTSFHTKPEAQIGIVMEVKNRIFPEPPYPNWTPVGVTWLSGFEFEIKVIASIPQAD